MTTATRTAATAAPGPYTHGRTDGFTDMTPATLPRRRAPGEDFRPPDPAEWYRRLGWPADSGPGGRLLLLTGVRFDVLDVPFGAGLRMLRRLGPAGTGPVAAGGQRMRFLTEPGGAEEVPGLLQWLEWGGIALDLRTSGTGGTMPAPAPAAGPAGGGARTTAACLPDARVPRGVRAVLPWEAADQALPVWVRPPLPGIAEALPSVGLAGTRGAGSPDLARLVAAAADECHRARLFPLPPRSGYGIARDGRPQRARARRQAWALS